MMPRASIAATFLTGLAQGVLGLLIGIVVARILGPHGKGEYALVQLIAGTAASIATCNLGESAIYFRNRFNAGLGTILLTGSAFFGVAAGLYCLIVSALSWFHLLPWTELQNPINLPFAVVLMPIVLMRAFLLDVLRAVGRFVAYNISIFVQVLSYGALVIPILLYFQWAVAGALFSALLSYFFAAVFSLAYLVRSYEVHWKWDSAYLKESLAYGLKGHVGSIFHKMNSRLDQFIIAPYCGTSALGQYSVAVMLAEVIYRVPDAIGIVALPHIAKTDQHESARWTAKAFRTTSLVALLFLAATALVADRVVAILFGAAFQPSGTALLLLLPGSFFMCWSKLLSKYFSGTGRPGISTMTSLACLVATIALCFLLVPKYCLAGAAVASSVSYALRAALDVYVFLHLSRCRPAELFVPRITDIIELVQSLRGVIRSFREKR